MTERPKNPATRIPEPVSIEAVLDALPVGADEAALAAGLTLAFPDFAFSATSIDDSYWLSDRSVLAADGTRLGALRPWMEAELARHGGNVEAVWKHLLDSDLQISEWHGTNVFAFAPTGSGVADYVQVSVGRETEWRAGPIVDPGSRPYSEEGLWDPSWTRHGEFTAEKVLAGPVYRLPKRASSGVVHMRSFLARCAWLEREKREARRPELERRVLVGGDGSREVPFLELVPDWFDFVPREVRFFQDWERSSAAGQRVFEHWALDISDYEYRGERVIGFIPRPLRPPAKRLKAEGASVHVLMDRIEAIDQEIGLKFGWFFLMTHGNWIEPEVGDAIVAGLREQRVRLPDRDEKMLLGWADKRYAF